MKTINRRDTIAAAFVNAALKRGGGALFISGFMSLTLLCPGAVAAGRAPAVFTGGAGAVTYDSATLTGEVNPRGVESSYYFQYGPTTAYGSQSAIGSIAPGTRTVKVSEPITGLQPLTVYHYRLVSLSSAGGTNGASRAFKTTKVPLSLAILGAPNPVQYGGTAAIEGTLSGTGNAGREVVLQQNPFPYTQGFANDGNPEITTATGSFSFPVTGLTQATQFRVVTASKATIVSPVVIENVAVGVTAHVKRTSRRHRVRIYGTVTPAEVGMEVGILRLVHGRNKLVAGTTLRRDSATSSTYSHTMWIVPGGIYVVLVRITDGSHTSAYSTPMRIH